jgi:hypothetical membrane protein
MSKRWIIGLAAAIAAYPFILVSIVLSPWFNIYNNALSDLGNTVTNGSVGYIYNAGLILSGALVFIFAALTLKVAPKKKFAVWTITLMISAFDLALVGIFSENTGSIHGVVSEVFFAMIVVTMLTFSYVSWPLGSPRIGALALAFGILSALIWTINWPWTGVAIQETITSGMTAIWLIFVALKSK